MELSFLQEKLRKNPTGCQTIVDSVNSANSVGSIVCQESCSYPEVSTNSTSTLQSTAEVYELCDSTPGQLTNTREFDTVVLLDFTSRADLNWWITLDKRLISAPVNVPMPPQAIDSDAYMKGWSAILSNQTCTGTLLPTESIPSHQLLIASSYLSSIEGFWEDLDNATRATYINQKGGTALSSSHLNVDVVHRK